MNAGLAGRCLLLAAMAGAAVGCHGDEPVPIGSDVLPPCTSRGLAPWEQTWLIPHNASSPWLAPWRAYQDTWPADRLPAAAGVRFDDDDDALTIAARAPVVAAAGLRRYGISVAWSVMDPDAPTRLLPSEATLLRARLGVLARHGLRPVIRVHATPSAPGPVRRFEVVVTTAAPAGARVVSLDAASAAKIVPDRTGLDLGPGTPLVLFTAVDAAGVATLSRPLDAELAPGAHPATTTIFPPFARPRLADGRPNPGFEVPFAGFLAFVRAVAAEAMTVIGGEDFDLVLWGRTYEGQALEIDEYYEPDVDDAPGLPYEDTPQAIRARVAASLRDEPPRYPSIGIADGFADVTSFAVEAASTGPRGLTARSRRVDFAPIALPEGWDRGPYPTLDAQGALDGAFAPDGLWDPAFVPQYTSFFPEQALSAVLHSSWRPGQIWRDLSPIATPFGDEAHGRNVAMPGGGRLGLWIDDMSFRAELPLEPAARDRLVAKWMLRALAAYVAKGSGSVLLGGSSPSVWIDPALPDGGPALAAIGRMLRPFVEAPRAAPGPPLWLARVTSCSAGVQFVGDGTSAHPSLSNRDVVAAFPFRAGDADVIVLAYVMTRDVRAEPAPETFELTFEGARDVVAIDARDPLDDVDVPVTVLERRGDRLVVAAPLRPWPVLLRLRGR